MLHLHRHAASFASQSSSFLRSSFSASCVARNIATAAVQRSSSSTVSRNLTTMRNFHSSAWIRSASSASSLTATPTAATPNPLSQSATDAPSASATPIAPTLSSSYQPIESQQDRWTTLRTWTGGLLLDGGLPSLHNPSAIQYMHLPNMRTQPSSHENLQMDTRVDDGTEEERKDDDQQGDDDAILRSYLINRQSLDIRLHNEPILITPAIRALWKRMLAWDRKYQVEKMQRERVEADEKAHSQVPTKPAPSTKTTASSATPNPFIDDDELSSLLSPEEDHVFLPSYGWSSRGLFLDGPQSIGKSTSLYTLACMARSQNWLCVYIDAESWLPAMQTRSATRMMIQAIYEACASTILPSTKEWSQPQSVLTYELDPTLEYTATLREQGISTIGELLTLSLELEDGLEETELSVECVMEQLYAIKDMPVLVCLDSFDQLTQKCLQSQRENDEDGASSSPEEDLIAPITTSPFSYLNYHSRSIPPFRGGFIVAAESFALVQQTLPELSRTMEEERESKIVDEDEDEDEKIEVSDSPVIPSSSKSRLQSQTVDSINVYPLPPLSLALSTEYLLRQLFLTHQEMEVLSSPQPSPAPAALLVLSQADATFLFHHVHNGYMSLMDEIVTIALLKSNNCVTQNDVLNRDLLRSKLISSMTRANLQAYSTNFPTPELASSLSRFFLQHLPLGFYNDMLRTARRDAQIGYKQVVRDYNLIAGNMGETRGMLEWCGKLPIVRTGALNDTSSSSQVRIHDIITSTTTYNQLISQDMPPNMSKERVQMLQVYKQELLLQCVAMAMMAESVGTTHQTTDQKSLPQPRLITSVQHWCTTTSPILHLPDFHPATLHIHWTIPPQVDSASKVLGLAPQVYVTRLVHLGKYENESIMTLFAPNLDPHLTDLLCPTATTPVTQLMHTLYLHYLSDILQQFSLCLGPQYEVSAVGSDGISYKWKDLDQLVEMLQDGMFDMLEELPMQTTVVKGLKVERVGEVISSGDQLQIPKLRVCFVSPHGRLVKKEVAAAAAAGIAQSNAPPTSSSSSSTTTANIVLPTSTPTSTAISSEDFHPMFRFMEPIVGDRLAHLLDVDIAELQKIRWV